MHHFIDFQLFELHLVSNYATINASDFCNFTTQTPTGNFYSIWEIDNDSHHLNKL